MKGKFIASFSSLSIIRSSASTPFCSSDRISLEIGIPRGGFAALEISGISSAAMQMTNLLANGMNVLSARN